MTVREGWHQVLVISARCYGIKNTVDVTAGFVRAYKRKTPVNLLSFA
jgi:hypothetical protein